jgi:hypothetical protein
MFPREFDERADRHHLSTEGKSIVNHNILIVNPTNTAGTQPAVSPERPAVS